MKTLAHSTQAFVHTVALAMLAGSPWLTYGDLRDRLGCHYRTALNLVRAAENEGLIFVERKSKRHIFTLTLFAVRELEKTWTRSILPNSSTSPVRR